MNDIQPRNTRSRERFLDAILQSAIEYAIISLDLDSLVTSWNEGAVRILGWTPEEAIGKPAAMIFTDQDIALALSGGSHRWCWAAGR